MALKTDTQELLDSSHPERESGRRDFLYVAAGAVVAVGGAFAIWPFIDNMNPSADVVALSSVEIDISQIEKGQRVTVAWRGRPVFIDYRTEAQIARARMDDTADLIDPERDDERVQRAEWLIVIGICTHLGCVPLGQRNSDPLGQWGGWFCPCHGSHYDTSGRIRKGPAPKNLVVPPYAFLADEMLRIG
ncbi:ubiquinol-cytochrome c reductase iron-sulfur subunit [uncultured Sneathiella sp.]|uniref:ubiquinol-cytochrome c reductase iron-sulfur subunit n=1 Tax=uncultured Sneathiella sp. TaxID=879315 RepID=UPI0030D9E503